MKVLIIEDDPKKLRELEDFISSTLPSATIVTRHAYQSGLEEINERGADVIILDMSMRTYDISPTEPGGRDRPYAGREILQEVKRSGLSPKVIVVTGFRSFGEREEKMALDELTASLENEFRGIYRTTVYYHPSESKWKKELAIALNDIS
jgi:DNA-binding NarL/FixJ family response regulator